AVDISSPVQQQATELVLTVVGRRQQRSPAVLGGLIHIGAGFEKDLSRLEIPFTRSKHERGQATASASYEACPDDFRVVIVVGIRRLLRRRLAASSASGATVLPGSASTLSASALTGRRCLSWWCLSWWCLRGLGLSRRRRRSREARGSGCAAKTTGFSLE